MVKLLTSDQQTVEVQLDVACEMETIQHIVQSDGSDDIIPVTTIKKDILDILIEFCTYIHVNSHPNIEKPLEGTEVKVDKWYLDFVSKFEAETLFDIILAADYLSCSSLAELASAKVASLIKGKTVQEQRDFFKI